MTRRDRAPDDARVLAVRLLSRIRWRLPLFAVVLVACVFVVAGCGSGSSATGGAPAAAASVVTKHVAGYGTVLATASGQTLYVLTADRPGESNCSGSCTLNWHPLILHGLPVAGPGVNARLLSTFRRGDGRTQVMYDGHPLYAYAGSEPASFHAFMSAL